MLLRVPMCHPAPTWRHVAAPLCSPARVKYYAPRASSIVQFSPADVALDRLVATYGFLNVSSITPGLISDETGSRMDDNKAAGYDFQEMNRMAGMEVGTGEVQTRLYTGRIITPGKRMGTRVLLKAYPGRLVGGSDADAMAANELVTHAILQEVMEDSPEISPHIAVLLGGFQSSTGEQWLVLRDDGTKSAVDYAQLASRATDDGTAVGEWEFWDRFDPTRPILRRHNFIIRLIRGSMEGLAFMHSRGRLHQSLGPASVLLNDAAFFGNSSFNREGGNSAVAELAESLWRRAASAGARLPMERKAFAIADDMRSLLTETAKRGNYRYAAGLLVAYLAFVPLCRTGSIDGPSLQRLLETTFRLDLRAAREYCAADERWIEAVKFLDRRNGAGWDLLQAMLNPEYRLRPTASAVLNHPFLNSGE